MKKIIVFTQDNWAILSLAGFAVYSALAEYLAHTKRTKANSPIQFLKVLLGVILKVKKNGK